MLRTTDNMHPAMHKQVANSESVILSLRYLLLGKLHSYVALHGMDHYIRRSENCILRDWRSSPYQWTKGFSWWSSLIDSPLTLFSDSEGWLSGWC